MQTAKQVEDVLGIFTKCSGSQEIPSKCWHWPHTDAAQFGAGQTGKLKPNTHMCGLQRVYATVFLRLSLN